LPSSRFWTSEAQGQVGFTPRQTEVSWVRDQFQLQFRVTLEQTLCRRNQDMIDDDRNRRNTHGTGNRVVCAPKCNIKRADLALYPFGMNRRSFAPGRQLQRAVRSALACAGPDRFW